jgi:hypothetical protein
VKPASLKWQCIPDPASPCKITLWKCPCPSLAGPCFPVDNRPWTMRHQPCSSHSRSWLVYAWWKLEELPISPLRINSFSVFFLLILVSSLPGDPQALDYDSCMHTTWVGSVVTKTLVFILIILVQAQLLGHAPTTIPPTQCALLMVSIFVLTPFIALRSNG